MRGGEKNVTASSKKGLHSPGVSKKEVTEKRQSVGGGGVLAEKAHHNTERGDRIGIGEKLGDVKILLLMLRRGRKRGKLNIQKVAKKLS